MQSMQYLLLTQKATTVSKEFGGRRSKGAYKLKLYRHKTEVDYLNQRPDHEVRLEGWKVHIP